MTYTNDQRFQAIHPDGSDEWILKVSSAQPRDSGEYDELCFFDDWRNKFSKSIFVFSFQAFMNVKYRLSLS